MVAEAVPSNEATLYQNSVLTQNVYEKFEPAVFRSLRTDKDVHHHKAVTQEDQVVEQNVTPIKVNGNVIGALIMEKDITRQIKNEEKLYVLSRATETISELFKYPSSEQIFVPDMIEEALFYLDTSFVVQYYNLKGEKIVQDLTDKQCDLNISILDIFPDFGYILNDDRVIVIENRAILNKHFQIKCIKLFTDQKLTGYLMMLKDITDAKEKEKAVISKTVAIREVHHRVKNNLQTVASLLRLQMRMDVPEESKHYFQESLNRILCIASVYEVILSESDSDHVNIATLIEKIGNALVYSETAEQAVNISYDIDNQLYLPSHLAISVALIGNEIITNSLQHAFKQTAKGNIVVTLCHEQTETLYTLKVQDNGTGDGHYSSSFGLNIVSTIAENDLDGHFNIAQNDTGTLAQLVFQYKGE